MAGKHRLPTNNTIAFGLAVLITAAWAVSFILDIVVKEYDPPASVHALMMIVAGGVFGEGLIRTRTGQAPAQKVEETT